MPLSQPHTERQPIHYRNIAFKGFHRSDGLMDIEGHLVDVKTQIFEGPTDRNAIASGTPVHQMRLRFTIDTSMTIRNVEAVTEHGPFGMCPNIARNYKSLTGLRIGKGWTRQALERVGGVSGCTHITEMIRQMATVAYQTQFSIQRMEKKRAAKTRPHPPSDVDALVPDTATPHISMLNSCHAFAEDSPVVSERFPEMLNSKGTDGSKAAAKRK